MFEEGLWIPICKLMRAGERNDDVWRFILSNVRQPDHMAGDLHAQMASGEVGAQRLLSLCARHGLDDIEALADEIIERSEAATRASIAQLPAGTYHASAELDLADGSRIDIVCAVTVDPERGEILVDYDGSSDASPYGINVVKNYTHAYTTFTVRSVLNPDLPNNHGSLAPIKVEAPEGSIVNAVSPQPCTARHVVGMFLPNALLKALAQIRPEAAMAEGSGAVWTMQINGNHPDGRPFITAMFTYAGGVGARGHQARPRRLLLPHRRGRRAGRGRRGVGARSGSCARRCARVRAAAERSGAGSARRSSSPSTPTAPWQLNAVTSRLAVPPEGIFGGEPGAPGRSRVNGEPVRTQSRFTLQPGDHVRLDLPGGGGYGEPEPPQRGSATVSGMGRAGVLRRRAGGGPWPTGRTAHVPRLRAARRRRRTSGRTASSTCVAARRRGVAARARRRSRRRGPPRPHQLAGVRRRLARMHAPRRLDRPERSDGAGAGARRAHRPHPTRRSGVSSTARADIVRARR